MTQSSKPDLIDHDEEAIPFDDVMRKLLQAKPAPKDDNKPPEETDEQ